VSLRVRIALISAAAVAIAIAIAAMVTFNATQRELIAEVDSSLYDKIEQIEAVDSPFELAAVLGSLEERGSRGPFTRGTRGFDAIFWQFVIGQGVPAVTDYPADGGLPFGPEEQAVLDGKASFALRTVNVGDDNLRVLTVAMAGGTFQVARSLAEVDNSLAGLASVLRFAAVVGILLAGVVGYFVARGAARPIGQLAAAAEHVAETQELAARIDVDRNDEVGRLAHSFNSMLAALEGSREQQRRLVRDAGHELRTPLTAIRTNVELLAKVEDLPADERARMIEDIDSEIQELSTLVAELVEMAADPITIGSEKHEANLGDVAERVVEKYRRRTGHDIKLDADDSMVYGQVAQLERAISNLIDNATKWSPDGSAIDVTVSAGRVTVSDQGPGIDEQDRPYVFDRFFRATLARSTPGSGLGLSIVAKVAVDHGGSVFVGEPVAGASVGFEIPVVAT
jgi:two-component system sensor histidine kinase MprB